MGKMSETISAGLLILIIILDKLKRHKENNKDLKVDTII